MAKTAYTFDEQSARRIARTVKRVESQPTRMPKKEQRYRARGGGGEFIALIADDPEPVEVIAGQQWSYPIFLIEKEWTWDAQNNIATYTKAATQPEEQLWATNAIEQRSVSQYEERNDDCPEPAEGDELSPGDIKRIPIPPLTPVRCRWIGTDAGLKPIIVGILGSTHNCGHCPSTGGEPEE